MFNVGTEQLREVYNGWLHRSLCNNVVVRSTASSTAIKRSPFITQCFDFQTLSWTSWNVTGCSVRLRSQQCFPNGVQR